MSRSAATATNQPVVTPISSGGEPGWSITPTNRVMISATMAVTAVSSPRGQDSAWPRAMIQARMRGATAAIRNTKRNADSAAQPVQEVLGPRQLPSSALRLPSVYQLRNRDTPNRIPPATATTSPRSSSLIFIVGAA